MADEKEKLTAAQEKGQETAEISREAEPEKEKSFKETVEEHRGKIKTVVKEAANEGDALEGILVNNGTDETRKKEFNRNKRMVMEKLEDAEKEYENTFRTPGDIENQANIMKDEFEEARLEDAKAELEEIKEEIKFIISSRNKSQPEKNEEIGRLRERCEKLRNSPAVQTHMDKILDWENAMVALDNAEENVESESQKRNKGSEKTGEEEKIEKETKKAKEEHENSFRTPGDIESEIRAAENQEVAARTIEDEKTFSLEINFYDEDGEKREIPNEYETIVEKAKMVASQENEYYRKFFKGQHIIDKLECEKSEDNFRATDDKKVIVVPFQNPEILEDTIVLERHEATHRAVRMNVEDKGEWDMWGRNFKDFLEDNVKEGKDSDLDFIGKIRSSQFKKFLGREREGKLEVGTSEQRLSKILFGEYPESNVRHHAGDIEYLIEEILADEMMLKREREINPEGAIERVTQAKIAALDNIAKNEGYKSWKEYPSWKGYPRPGGKGFFGNFYNTFKFLSRINAEAGNIDKSMEFGDFADERIRELKIKIKEGYNEDFSAELDDLANRFQNLLEKED